MSSVYDQIKNHKANINIVQMNKNKAYSNSRKVKKDNNISVSGNSKNAITKGEMQRNWHSAMGNYENMEE